jgi:hypothetical protein
MPVPYAMMTAPEDGESKPMVPRSSSPDGVGDAVRVRSLSRELLAGIGAASGRCVSLAGARLLGESAGDDSSRPRFGPTASSFRSSGDGGSLAAAAAAAAALVRCRGVSRRGSCAGGTAGGEGAANRQRTGGLWVG